MASAFSFPPPPTPAQESRRRQGRGTRLRPHPAGRAADPAAAQRRSPPPGLASPGPERGFVVGFCASCFVRSPRPGPGPSPSGLPARPLLTSSTKSIARARAAAPPAPPRPAPPLGFLLGIMGALCGLISLLRGREAGSASPAAVGENESGIRPGLGPRHSKTPPGIRPFKAPLGGLVTLFLKLFVFLKWPLRRERGLGRGGGGGGGADLAETPPRSGARRPGSAALCGRGRPPAAGPQSSEGKLRPAPETTDAGLHP